MQIESKLLQSRSQSFCLRFTNLGDTESVSTTHRPYLLVYLPACISLQVFAREFTYLIIGSRPAGIWRPVRAPAVISSRPSPLSFLPFMPSAGARTSLFLLTLKKSFSETKKRLLFLCRFRDIVRGALCPPTPPPLRPSQNASKKLFVYSIVETVRILRCRLSKSVSLVRLQTPA